MADLSHSQLWWYIHSSTQLSGHSNCTAHTQLCIHHNAAKVQCADGKSQSKNPFEAVLDPECDKSNLCANYHHTSGHYGLQLVTGAGLSVIPSSKLVFYSCVTLYLQCLKLTMKTVYTPSVRKRWNPDFSTSITVQRNKQVVWIMITNLPKSVLCARCWDIYLKITSSVSPLIKKLNFTAQI